VPQGGQLLVDVVKVEQTVDALDGGSDGARTRAGERDAGGADLEMVVQADGDERPTRVLVSVECAERAVVPRRMAAGADADVFWGVGVVGVVIVIVIVVGGIADEAAERGVLGVVACDVCVVRGAEAGTDGADGAGRVAGDFEVEQVVWEG
jgi:hypothetical protein